MKRWQILSDIKNKKSNLSTEKIIDILLKNRGLKTKKEIEYFLHPQIENITLKSVGIDTTEVEKTINKIQKAIINQEQIIIYGDYDVDGLTATAILWETLFFGLKAKVTPYIPHRIDEGYGLSVKGIDNLIEKYPDLKLIITVDNGIVANAAVDYANTKKIDCIITDHHIKGDRLPDAFSIVHTTKLCGAGIAWVLAREIVLQMANEADERSEEARLYVLGGQWQMENDPLLELATLGTIADLVPLKEANRTIVKYGLEKLSHTKRPGLNALYEEAGIDNSSIGAYEVGHVIAPRLNATGRMESAMDSLRLLCTKNLTRAHELASLLGVTNKERQNVMIDAVKHASLSVHDRAELKKLLIVTHDSYPEGVIGLVAGRLVEEFYRPSVVIAKGEKLSKGSVRSISGFNIIEFLRQSSEYFVNIGGHPMAAGFTVETEKIDKMTEALEHLAFEMLNDDLFIRSIRIDCEIPLEFITDKFYEALQLLSPFGMGNPEPVFMSRNLTLKDLRVLGREGKHLRLHVNQDDTEIEAIAFGFGEQVNNFHIGGVIDLAYIIDENKWNGRRKLQLKVKDIKVHN